MIVIVSVSGRQLTTYTLASQICHLYSVVCCCFRRYLFLPDMFLPPLAASSSVPSIRKIISDVLTKVLDGSIHKFSS